MKKLTKIIFHNREFFVDYQLGELRDVHSPWLSIAFEDVDNSDLRTMLLLVQFLDYHRTHDKISDKISMS